MGIFSSKFSFSSVFACAMLLFGNSCFSQKMPPNLLVGAAEAAVNPPMGAFIAGDKQDRHFTSISDSLYAKAVVVYDGKTALALVTVDCIGLLYPAVNEIRKRAAELVKNIPLPASHIVVSSTHTHSGPDVVGIWGKDFTQSGVDDAYMEQLVNTAAQQVALAAQRLEPVILQSAASEFGEGFVENICKEEIDRSVTVLQFVGAKGQNVASFTNFACHPTYLDSKYSTVSADFPAGFYQKMNAEMGGINIFLQGAIGGWVQPEGDPGNYETALRRGNELADLVLTALQKPKTEMNTAVRIKTLPLSFRLENEGWKQLSALGTIKRSFGETVDTELAWFAIGDAQFATHPGETTPWHGLETKKMMKTDGPKFVLGLGMDALGYILKPEYFHDPTLPHAPYLTSMSVGKQTGPAMMEGLRKLMTN
jgi:Neutral/alkaline non-lysosomal ceramidase, N-terminal